MSAGDTGAQNRPGGGFATNVLKLASGTTIAQLVVLAAAPALTRLYEPSAFGAAALFAAVTGISIVVACLRYDPSIVLPESDDEGGALLWASLAMAGLTSGIVLVVLVLLPESVLVRLGADAISAYVPLAVLATGLGGAFYALTNWHTRTQKFGFLARARVMNTTATAVVQITGGLLASGSATMLVSGSLAGNWLATLTFAGRAAADDRDTLLGSLRLKKIVAGMKRHWRFPVYNAGTAVMNTVSWQLPALVLGLYFSSTVVGYYALGWRLLAMPMSLIGSAIGQVFYQRAAIAWREGGLDTLVRGVFSVLVDVGLVPFVVLSLAGSEIFEFVFGPEWTEAGVYVQILAIYTLVWFISAPFSSLFLVLERQDQALRLNVAILLTRLGSLVLGGWLGNARVGLAIFAVTGVVVYGYMNHWAMTHSGVPVADTWRIIGRAALRAIIPCGLVLLVVLLGLGNVWVTLVAAVAITASTLRAFAAWRRVLGGRRVDNERDAADVMLS